MLGTEDIKKDLASVLMEFTLRKGPNWKHGPNAREVPTVQVLQRRGECVWGEHRECWDGEVRDELAPLREEMVLSKRSCSEWEEKSTFQAEGTESANCLLNERRSKRMSETKILVLKLFREKNIKRSSKEMDLEKVGRLSC